MTLFQKRKKSKKGHGNGESLGIMSQMCDNGLFEHLLEEYIHTCHTSCAEQKDGNSHTRQKSKTRFANLAGFCRYMGTGLSELAELRSTHPDEYDRLLTIFEDEALNSEVSPTLLSAYLKKRMQYSSIPEEANDAKEVRYCFEHDIFADGE
jgi:hypothetical protein